RGTIIARHSPVNNFSQVMERFSLELLTCVEVREARDLAPNSDAAFVDDPQFARKRLLPDYGNQPLQCSENARLVETGQSKHDDAVVVGWGIEAEGGEDKVQPVKNLGLVW